MRGLLLKDYINIKGQLKIYLGMVVLWLAVGMFNHDIAFFSGLMMVFIVMIPITAIACDEKCNWDRFALTMPVSRKTLMMSKYLFMFMVLLATALVSLAGALIIGGDLPDSLLTMMAVIPVGICINAVDIPIMLHFGVEKGRFIFIGFAAFFALLAFVSASLPESSFISAVMIYFLDTAFSDIARTIALFWIAALICTCISMMVSRRIYEKKDF